MRKFVGIVTAVYVASLWLFLFTGPILLSTVMDTTLEVAFHRTIAIVGVGYLIVIGLLLR